MAALPRVELQAEIARSRDELFGLVSTSAGLGRWLDGAELEPEVGAVARFELGDAVATGVVLAIDPPQHVSYSWDWAAEPLGHPSVVAFDLVAHGAGTHVTLRHVGLRTAAQLQLHEAMWHHWFGRLLDAVAAGQAAPAPTSVA